MKVTTKENLVLWLEHMSADHQVIAPQMVEKVLLYRPLSNPGEIVWDYIRPVMSIKEFFFPSTEKLFNIEKGSNGVSLVEPIPSQPRIIFGVRPCDARGLLALDALFIDSQPGDKYYSARRENTTLIGIACNEMGDTCFCTSMGGSPTSIDGLDLMLTETEAGFIIEPITSKGEALVNTLAIEDKPVQKPPTPLPAGKDRQIPDDWPNQFSNRYWDVVSERCISCRICAYVCPTCRCFDIRDEQIPSENGKQLYERIRCWDSCTGQAYRRIAGGHNPRKEKTDRIKNRMFCKFYYYPEQYGPIACTGCGRCIESCPVNIDITEVLDHLIEVEP